MAIVVTSLFVLFFAQYVYSHLIIFVTLTFCLRTHSPYFCTIIIIIIIINTITRMMIIHHENLKMVIQPYIYRMDQLFDHMCQLHRKHKRVVSVLSNSITSLNQLQ
jgi:hypothetical protein